MRAFITSIIAATLIIIIWAALDRITGSHTDLITSFSAAFCGALLVALNKTAPEAA